MSASQEVLTQLSDFTHSETTRRSVLQGMAKGVALASLPTWFVSESSAATAESALLRPRRIGPNDTINVGLIGPGGPRGGYRQGLGVARGMATKKGVKVVAVCDVDKVHLDSAATHFGTDTAKYVDYRELLRHRDLDAVIIGTPDHWHAVQAVDAMKAGLDVYCEKPLTLTIGEGRDIVRATNQGKRVFQTGSQQRSDARFRMACELVRNGRVGRLRTVTTHLPGGPAGGPFEAKPVPEGFDWNLWLGPAPMTPYIPERTHGNFRWWLEYSGGMLTDWGAHHNDIAQWALGMDDAGPLSVEGVGKNPPLVGQNFYNTYPEFDVRYLYPNGVVLRCTNQGENGVMFEGDEGWIFVSRGRIGASDPKLLEAPLPSNAVRLEASNDHIQNFVDCVRSRKKPICHAEVGHRSVTVCHMANISLRLGGRKLAWDARREQFLNDQEANLMLNRPRRKWA
jgi:predicted dehydrogenase